MKKVFTAEELLRDDVVQAYAIRVISPGEWWLDEDLKAPSRQAVEALGKARGALWELGRILETKL